MKIYFIPKYASKSISIPKISRKKKSRGKQENVFKEPETSKPAEEVAGNCTGRIIDGRNGIPALFIKTLQYGSL
jgi:hypothetical protein